MVPSGRTVWMALVSRGAEKSPEPSRAFNVIGVMIDLRAFPLGEILMMVTARRLQALEKLLKMIMLEGRLGSGQAASLAGKLGFTVSATFGRVGRARIELIIKRAYSKMKRLDLLLTRTILWWLRFLKQYRPREVPTHSLSMPLVISYSDGEGKYAGVGAALWALWLPWPLAAFTTAPQKMRDIWAAMADKQDYKDIYLIEGVGPLVLLYVPKVMRKTRIRSHLSNRPPRTSFEISMLPSHPGNRL